MHLLIGCVFDMSYPNFHMYSQSCPVVLHHMILIIHIFVEWEVAVSMKQLHLHT